MGRARYFVRALDVLDVGRLEVAEDGIQLLGARPRQRYRWSSDHLRRHCKPRVGMVPVAGPAALPLTGKKPRARAFRSPAA